MDGSKIPVQSLQSLISIYPVFFLFQLLARLEEVQQQRRSLHADKEALSLRLADREKQIDGLRSQMESSNHTSEQHRQSINQLHRENGVLRNQLNQHKLETRQLEVSGAAEYFAQTSKHTKSQLFPIKRVLDRFTATQVGRCSR